MASQLEEASLERLHPLGVGRNVQCTWMACGHVGHSQLAALRTGSLVQAAFGNVAARLMQSAAPAPHFFFVFDQAHRGQGPGRL